MKINEIDEAFNVGPMPEPENLDHFKQVTSDGAIKIKDLTAKLSLYKNGHWYSLMNEDGLVGSVKITPRDINGTKYSHIDVIYILPEYRKTTAIKWLIYSAKEMADYRIIADGAIFSNGQELLKHHMMQTKILDKITGEITPFAPIKYDPDKCYIFEKTNVGFGKQMLPEGVGYSWYNFFEDT